MNKTIFSIALAAAALAPVASRAELTVKVAPALGVEKVYVRGFTFDDMVNSRRPVPAFSDSIVLKGGEGTLKTPLPATAYYSVKVGEMGVPVYAAESDKLLLEVTSPQDFTIAGSQLMDDYGKLLTALGNLEKEYDALQQSGNVTPEAVQQLNERYEATTKNFVADNPGSPAVALALLDLSGSDFMDAYDKLQAQLEKSPFFPLVKQRAARVADQIAKEKRTEEMQSGNFSAPDFALADLAGKTVKLSDYRGKWVVIDFWGSWCKWCIKGFPELKDVYAKYKGEIEVIGIDNQDSPEQWRAAVERFQLPWVNVYNPGVDESGVVAAYAVQGYPTKVIVSPEGKIAKIFVGEDPSFTPTLEKLLGK